MRRNRKKDRLEASTSTSRPEEDHDLAYFIHDKVELMRQVFCALTPKEIKAMAPAALRKSSNDELEELCLEELLGISSKRLCAVLDGAEAPSDTESSSNSSEPPPVTIELDSSDEKSKSSGRSKNKSKKKRERRKKNKSLLGGEGDAGCAGGEQGRDDDRTSARGSAGLTVLELLELQARARALKAQLRATEALAGQPASLEPCSERASAVKEEQAIVVEISSDEEKPNIGELKTKAGIEPQPVTTNKKKNTADNPTLVSMIDDIVSTGNAAKKSSLQSSAKNSVNNKNKSKDNTKNKNTPQDSAFKSSWENEASGKTNNTKKSLEDSNKKKNNENLEVTAKKKNSEIQECSTSNEKEKEGAKKKKSKKNKRKPAEKSKETIEDEAKKNVESIVDAKAPVDDVTIVIDDDDDEPAPTQKSPVRLPSPRAAPLPAAAAATSQLTTRTIQLDRNNVVISLTTAETARETRIASTVTSVRKLHSSVKKVQKKRPVTPDAPKVNSVVVQAKEKVKEGKRKKVNKRKKSMEDRDEITLQLSDSEKMDLLEDLDRSALDKVSSSSAASTVTSDSGDDSDGKDKGDVVSVDSDEVSSTVPAVVEDVSELVQERVGDGKDKGTKENKDKENLKDIFAAKATEKPEEEISNDTAIDSTTNENDVIDIVINQDVDIKDSSDEGSNVSPEKKAPITTQSMLIGEDEINQQNINVNNGNTIEVSCINDIPLIPDDYNLKLPDNVQGTTDNDDKTDSSEDSSADSDASDERSSSDEDAKPDEKMQGDSENFRQIEVTKDDNGEIVVDTECVVEETDKEKAEETIQSSKDIIEKIFPSERVPSEEGELSDKSSSDVEAFVMKPEVVCISDNDGDTEHTTMRKIKKTKKSKKLRKIKKHKKVDVANKGVEKLDKNADSVPGFVLDDGTTDDGIVKGKQIGTEDPKDDVGSADKESSQTVTVDSDDVYEILELSDDSSCFEVEGVSVLSKEPTSEEIVALSAKIDEIERQDVVTDQDIIEHEQQISTKQSETVIIENVSWKDRYLDSKKVKKVLTTSNIVNAMRKKNKELKKKMLEARQKEAELEAKEKEVEEKEMPQDIPVEEGSIEHYNTLQGSNKYVDPVPDKVEISDMEQGPSVSDNLDKTEVNETEQSDNIEKAPDATQETVTKEMKKDAKQLLKMYKCLLKYNDMNKPKDPNKKKKSKKQKKKKGGGSAAGVATCDT